MEQITRGVVAGEVVRVGVDLAKRVLQVHAVDAHGRVVARRALRRDAFLGWCAQLPPGCVAAMEISSSAHHWARRLVTMGFKPLLMSAQLVKPYRSEGATGKNDANDAAAICEAASRPSMRFVPVKSVEQQAMLCVHRLREGLKADRTACINRIRGLLAEFGLVFAQGPDALSSALADALEDGANEMNTLARRVVEHARAQWLELDAHIAWCDERIAQHGKDKAAVRQAAQLMGIGPITASAVIATVDDFAQFRNGAQFGAWCGITNWTLHLARPTPMLSTFTDARDGECSVQVDMPPPLSRHARRHRRTRIRPIRSSRRDDGSIERAALRRLATLDEPVDARLGAQRWRQPAHDADVLAYMPVARQQHHAAIGVPGDESRHLLIARRLCVGHALSGGSVDLAAVGVENLLYVHSRDVGRHARVEAGSGQALGHHAAAFGARYVGGDDRQAARER